MPNFSVYRGGDWNAKEFDTGKADIFASLANIPRQILEGAQMRKEGELKEREMGTKEKMAQANISGEERRSAASERVATSAEANSQLERDKFNRESEIYNSPEAVEARKTEQALLKLQMDRTRAEITRLGESGKQAYLEQKEYDFNANSLAMKHWLELNGGKALAGQAAEDYGEYLVKNPGIDKMLIFKEVLKKYQDDPYAVNGKLFPEWSGLAKNLNMAEQARYSARYPGEGLSPNLLNSYSDLGSSSNRLTTAYQNIKTTHPVFDTLEKNFPAGDNTTIKFIKMNADIIDDLMNKRDVKGRNPGTVGKVKSLLRDLFKMSATAREGVSKKAGNYDIMDLRW